MLNFYATLFNNKIISASENLLPALLFGNCENTKYSVTPRISPTCCKTVSIVVGQAKSDTYSTFLN